MGKKRSGGGAGGAKAPATSSSSSPATTSTTPPTPESGAGPRKPRSISLSAPSAAVAVALLSKNQQYRVEYGGGSDTFSLGEIYLNDLSDIRVFELRNTRSRRLHLQLKAEFRKPFHGSLYNFQLENENLNLLEATAAGGDGQAIEEYNHTPSTILRSSSKAALCAENIYLCDGYNELFNHIAATEELTLAPHETKRLVFSICAKLATQHLSGGAGHSNNADSSEEERMHLNETSCLVLSGRLTLRVRYDDHPSVEPRTPPLPIADVVIPVQGQVCRSLLRLDVKELHFDDCIPGGAFVKDFTVWNRSEIPLLFKLVSSISAFDETRDILTFTDYNSGYAIGEKTLQAAAYSHVRIRVTYRPVEIGERFFEVHVQNLHDSRNMKILKIHGVTNKEHHREGLSIKEPSGSYLMSGSKLDFGDCYSGIATSKILLIRNTTEASLHVELTSDRQKEVTFELKLQQNRSRTSRAPRADDLLSPTDSNDGSSRKGSLSPDAAKAAAAAFSSFDTGNSYGVDSDDDGEDNEGEFYEDEYATPPKRLSFEENPLVDAEDGDDEFEFDREPRAPSRSPPLSPKLRNRRESELANRRRQSVKAKTRRVSKALSRVRDGAYESGVESSNSVCSSPERKNRAELRRRTSSHDDTNGSNFLVETLDLPPGVERTILVWYCPSAVGSDGSSNDVSDGTDLKGSRLTKQTFRVSFRCFQIQGNWQQAQSRVYDRTLGKSIHIRARTCTSIVTVTPSILHLGDCNIGELKSSACMLTNHSELPTVVKPLVTSKVISTVPNDEMTLGPKQSLELKVEIIPRKINPNYSRLISIMNAKNKANIPQICVRSSNMDAHHVIYHSLFYKLLTQSRSAFLNFEHVAVNSMGIQVFDLENITNAPLVLTLQSSDVSRVRLFCFRQRTEQTIKDAPRRVGGRGLERSGMHPSLSSSSLSSQSSNSRLIGTLPLGTVAGGNTSGRHSRKIRRRRSIGCESELSASNKRSNKSTILRSYLSKKMHLQSPAPVNPDALKARVDGGSGSATPPILQGIDTSSPPDSFMPSSHHRGSFSIGTNQLQNIESSLELMSLLDLFERSRIECEQFCHSTMSSTDREQEIVGMVRERVRRFQALLSEQKLIQLVGNKDRNIRIPPKSQQRVIAVFSPQNEFSSPEASKMKIEKHKIYITLPPGGNKKAVADATRLDPGKASWATSKHPFDSRPSVRELLVKSRVCRSVMNVNQKNINFGRITVSSKSTKKLVVQNMSAIPLVYSVEKTGSISSAFLEIKEGECGVVKGFGTKDICFEFLPTLAGPFEEKLRLINVQDPENSISVTIKAKVVKRETFKLLQSGQVISFGKCLVGEKSEEIKIPVRNTSRKRREYVIQLDPVFSNPALRPSFFFAVDETPSAIITQAQEKKLDEELEKLEHKLRIAVTKKKTDKIKKLNVKISHVKALLSGEQVPNDAENEIEKLATDKTVDGVVADVYDSNSESEFSESEAPSSRLSRKHRKSSAKGSTESRNGITTVNQSSNSLHFALEAEATGRIVAYAVFQTARPSSSAPTAVGDETPTSTSLGLVQRSQKARKRQLKKDSAPLIGVGKLLLFEQQNKDVVKELQYNAEVFLRTPASESAYYRAIGKLPLPPVPHPGLSKRNSFKKVDGSAPDDEGKSVISSITSAASANLDRLDQHSLTLVSATAVTIPSTTTPSSPRPSSRVLVNVEQSQLGMIRRSTLLVPIEECPSETIGWIVTLSQTDSNSSIPVVVQWCPHDAFRGLLGLHCDVSPLDALVVNDGQAKADNLDSGSHSLLSSPLKIMLSCKHPVSLHFKWVYTTGSGFGSGTGMASCVSSSALETISKATQVAAGKIDFFEDLESSDLDSIARQFTHSLDVAIVKAVKRSLHVDSDVIDLGQHQQDSLAQGEFVLRNRSRHVVKFLLLAPSVRNSTGVGVSAGGEIAFECSTGRLEPQAQTVVKFTYRGCTPGQQNDQILVRNLSDRLDTTVVNVRTRIIRPVYVRIPELDPHATGQLDILDLGPCYVTPEMQDTSVDSPNVAIKFSKIHKLTLVSQVAESLLLCASSNLKTQCYVYEDNHLHREATSVVIAGHSSVDLYVAVRPRLSGDAFKSGSTRDLVGGIRMQLFRASDGSPSQEDRLDMVAEFTVKFVGIAGASLARVSPSIIDLGVERPWRSDTSPLRGRFELFNISKALPLAYRLFIASDTEGYSDDDHALNVQLNENKGEISPGDSKEIHFSVSPSGHGLFRRRILVENLHFPGKLITVDLVLFVDNGSLQVDLLPTTGHIPNTSRSATSIDLGIVPVIKLEKELRNTSITGGVLTTSDAEVVLRQYRIFAERAGVIQTSDALLSEGNRCIFLSNDCDQDLVVRPISSLPLVFQWRDVATARSGDLGPWLHIQPTAYSASLRAIRDLRLQENSAVDTAPARPTTIFYGGVNVLPSHTSCLLLIRFAPIAMTNPISSEIVSCGKQCPFGGFVAIQSFAKEKGHIGNSARTLKFIPIVGSYGESSVQVVEKSITLGKIGYCLGWKSTAFEIVVMNNTEIPAYFAMGGLPRCVVVKRVTSATPIHLGEQVEHGPSTGSVSTLRQIALQADRRVDAGSNAWKLPPLSSCVIELEFMQSAETIPAGSYNFLVKIFNLYNPRNKEEVLVTSQIVTSYAEVIVDPESSGGKTSIGEHTHDTAFFPPITVPPLPDLSGSAHGGPSFWFSIKNVFDVDLVVKLSCCLLNDFASMMEMVVIARSSNAPLSSVVLSPGDSVDVRVVCRVFPSARVSSTLLSAQDRHFSGDLFVFGSVHLDISVHNQHDASQHKEIIVKGKILPGRTFTLSSSSLQFYANATDLPSDFPLDNLPTWLKGKPGRDGFSSAGGSDTSGGVYQLRTITESFWIKNPSGAQPLNFAIDQVAMHNAGLCLVKGSSTSDMCAMSEYIQAVPVPSSGTIPPGEAVKVIVRLEEASVFSCADSSGQIISGEGVAHASKGTALLHKMRHHPSWRSNSWGAEIPDSANEGSLQNHMYLTVRDLDMSAEMSLAAEVDIHLMLQSSPVLSLPGSDGAKPFTMDRHLLGAAFAAREKRLSTPKKPSLPPTLSQPHFGEIESKNITGDGGAFDNFEELDADSISMPVGKKIQLPVLGIRGCTPAENSILDGTRYVIDVGQHTVRNGGEVEWEITVECHSIPENALPDRATADSVEYRLSLVDHSASSWVQLSRDRGTLDRGRNYQSIVLYFLRDVIGVYSTFLVLQNMANPSDLKVIQVKLEVVADLNALRGMSSGVDPTTNLFRVLVSSHGTKVASESNATMIRANSVVASRSTGNDSRLTIDYGEVYYHKLYHNHSIVLENASSMTLDFMLASNARPHEVGFSISPTSFSEVTTVTLAARSRVQVFIHFRPQPKPTLTSDVLQIASEHWNREVEVYVSCRLVKDFRETVVLRAICHQPHVTVNVAGSSSERIITNVQATPELIAQPTFLGMVFSIPESSISSNDYKAQDDMAKEKYLIVHNSRSDTRARVALRNDSMFFSVVVDANLSAPRGVEVDNLERGICTGRRSTLLVSIPPLSSIVFQVLPDVEALRKHRSQWDHSVKEHITLYNIKQFAEHYQVTLCFTCSNVTSYYIPPSIVESYPFSALEDTIAKFLQNYNATWKSIISHQSKQHDVDTSSKSSSPSIAEVLSELEVELEMSSPLSPRKLQPSSGFNFEPGPPQNRETLRQLLQSYRALYFDFYYITDELIWYGVRSNAVRQSLMLADLAYGVVFGHDVFRSFLSSSTSTAAQTSELPRDDFPRLLLPWIRQLRHFLSFFPENQEATLPLRQLYEQLHKFEVLGVVAN